MSGASLISSVEVTLTLSCELSMMKSNHFLTATAVKSMRENDLQCSGLAGWLYKAKTCSNAALPGMYDLCCL